MGHPEIMATIPDVVAALRSTLTFICVKTCVFYVVASIFIFSSISENFGFEHLMVTSLVQFLAQGIAREKLGDILVQVLSVFFQVICTFVI